MGTPKADLARHGHIAQVISDRMDRLGLTQTDLGRKIGASPKNPGSPVHTWLKCRGAPTPKYRAKLAEVLGVAEEALMVKPGDEVPLGRPPAVRPPAPVRGADVGMPVSKRHPLAFHITAEGRAHIALDLDLPLEKGRSLIRLLLDMDEVLVGAAA